MVVDDVQAGPVGGLGVAEASEGGRGSAAGHVGRFGELGDARQVAEAEPVGKGRRSGPVDRRIRALIGGRLSNGFGGLYGWVSNRLSSTALRLRGLDRPGAVRLSNVIGSGGLSNVGLDNLGLLACGLSNPAEYSPVRLDSGAGQLRG